MIMSVLLYAYMIDNEKTCVDKAESIIKIALSAILLLLLTLNPYDRKNKDQENETTIKRNKRKTRRGNARPA